MQVCVQAVDLARLLEQVRDAFAHQARESGLWLRLELRAPRAALQVRSDESLLRSVLDNLVGNALKFTHEGGVILSAERIGGVVGAHGSPQVRVGVCDTGIGIALEEQARVFDDFYQVANTERSRSKGVGLGLAIARRQMVLLNIACRLRSAVGEGATFELDMPAATAMAAGEAADRFTEGHRAAVPGTVAPLRVLVVDDEPDVRKALAVMLEALGVPVLHKPVQGERLMRVIEEQVRGGGA